MMIGKVTFNSGDEEMEAVLRDDGSWACDDKTVEAVLNASCGADDRKYHSFARGAFGYRAVNDAAKLLKGKAHLPPPPSDLPGTLH